METLKKCILIFRPFLYKSEPGLKETVYTLHPVCETARFMKWAAYKFAQFMNWEEKMWPVHEMGNFTNEV
jgi:hypothetical protein